METVCLFIDHRRERQVVQIICESYGYNVIPLPVEPASFSQLLQYHPETIIMEIPEASTLHLSFLRQIFADSRTSRIRILCYGDLTNNDGIRKITDIGRLTYYNRPLSTDKLRIIIRPKNTTGSNLRKEVVEGYSGELEDTAKIMDPSTPRSERISIMADKIGELLAFPFTIAKVLAVTQSSTTGANDLAKAIEIDPVIVSAILKTANSALYGKAGQKTSSIKDAIVRIGFNETKIIAVSLSVMMLFSDEENSVGFDRKAFWYHSLAVGVIAARLARQSGFSRYELAFVGGLLHDFGIILLDEYFPTFFSTTLRSATQKGISFLEEQQIRWKMTHNDVVCRLFEKWNLPEELQAPLRYWLKDFHWKHETDRYMTLLVHSVRVGEIITHSLSIGKECDEFIESLTPEVAEELKLNRSAEDQFFSAVNEEINLFTTYLQMPRIQISNSRDIPNNQRNGIANYIDLASLRFDPIEHYLISHDYQIVYNSKVEEIQSADTVPSILVFRTAETTDLNIIEPFTRIFHEEQLTNGDVEPQAIPVLIIGPQATASKYATLPPHCGFLPDTIDLRMVTFSIQRLMLGEPLARVEHPPTNQTVIQPEITKAETETGQTQPTITTRIIKPNRIVFIIHGHLTLHALPEIKELIGKVLNKTDSIVFDLTGSICDAPLLHLLDEFRKAIWQKNILIVLCSFETQPSEPHHEEMLYFKDETALISHLTDMDTIRKGEKKTI